MTKPKYEIEEEAGGYVRNGDVLEWHWKGEPEAKASSAPDEPEEKAGAAPKKRGRPKKTDA